MEKQCMMVHKKMLVEDVSHDSIHHCKDLRGMPQIHVVRVVVGVEMRGSCHHATSAHKHPMVGGAAISP